MSDADYYRWSPNPEVLQRAQRVVERSCIVDLHTHPRAIVPSLLRDLGERFARVPRDPLSNLHSGGVDVAIVTAVGDPIGTAWNSRHPYRSVERQIVAAQVEAEAANDVNVSNVNVSNLEDAIGSASEKTSMVLGVEGSDFLGDDPENLAKLQELNIRVLGLVHYADNALGTIGTSFLGKRGSRATLTGRRSRGLTQYGSDLVCELNSAGILIDLAHADTETTVGACAESRAPVVSSHTAASSIRDFPRYMSDEAIVAVAETGGVVGLWPMKLREMAMIDLSDFARHAAHIADLVGVEHIGIGTDKNGVVSYAAGYSGSEDIVNLAAALLEQGFSETECAAILGGNAIRVLRSALLLG